ncbi:hypothetical protein HPB49_019166 [Dermacentor silvarum]|uniref:Uncharacterized protein n=1 Tax=Dermacentor silvarum TaxID=543639 RepID=A0ACB8D7N0_DERSI|nr:hypothetical protein HPB49_019166 [Dermacentor silvarum]
MRCHKCFKAGARKVCKLVEEDMCPAGVAQEAYAQQRPDQAAYASRLEALAGLKVEYARAYIATEEPETESVPMELLFTSATRTTPQSPGPYTTVSWRTSSTAPP